jgi:putative ABC transport system permease protein
MEAFALLYRGRSIRVSPAGVIKTGADEDSRVYLSLDDFESWTGLRPSVVEIAAYGAVQSVHSLASELESSLPDAEVRIVRQITEGDANILAKTRSTLLASAVFIASTTALSILATLMGWAFDRRRDFAIMKALGASARRIECFVAAEAALVGALGAVVGFAAGIGLAAWIGRVNFHATIEPRFALFPPVFAGSIALTLVASLFALELLGRIQPAMILRGE